MIFSGIHGFDSEEDLQAYFQRHKNNRDFAVIFSQDGSNGQLNYTIRTRNNNFRTEQIYMDNIYEISKQGKNIFRLDSKSDLIKCVVWFHLDKDEYVQSGFLALQRAIDKAYIEITNDQSRDEFKVYIQILKCKCMHLIEMFIDFDWPFSAGI